jgi:hypothetical protein
MAVSFLKSPGFTGRADTTAQPRHGSLVIGNLFFVDAKPSGAAHKEACGAGLSLVIASQAKQSMAAIADRRHGLPRRCAPRNDELSSLRAKRSNPWRPLRTGGMDAASLRSSQ